MHYSFLITPRRPHPPRGIHQLVPYPEGYNHTLNSLKIQQHSCSKIGGQHLNTPNAVVELRSIHTKLRNPGKMVGVCVLNVMVNQSLQETILH